MSDIGTSVAVRIMAAVTAVCWSALGWGWHTAAPWATALWPWPEVPMTFVFLASIAASIVVIWASVAWTGELAALSGVGLNTAIAGAGAGLHLWTLNLLGPAVAAFAASVFGVLLFVWARRQPVRDTRAMPTLARAAFVAFTVTLIVAGGALTLSHQVFPWRLHPSALPVVGAVFLGAAAYFGHAALQSRWVHAAPPLWGFLAYDVVLFGPYLSMLGADASNVDDFYGDGESVNMLSLTIYLSVLAASTAIALYFALVHPLTRVLGRRAGARAP